MASLISADDKSFCEHLASLPGWEIAAALGCEYDGDCDPIEHDGFFYDPRDWEAYGYASAVEFWTDPDTDDLVVQPGTINKPNDSTMEACWRCCGIDTDDPCRALVAAHISAVRAYCGIESDGTSYPNLKRFDLETWKEWRIWRSVLGWLQSLGS